MKWPLESEIDETHALLLHLIHDQLFQQAHDVGDGGLRRFSARRGTVITMFFLPRLYLNTSFYFEIDEFPVLVLNCI